MHSTWYHFFLTGCMAWVSVLNAAGLDLSKPEVAETELESLVADWRVEWVREATPTNAQGLATSLQALGMIERQAGKPTEAEDHLKSACTLMAEYAPGLLDDAREALALTFQDLGRLEAGETVLREVLAKRLTAGSGAKLAATCDHLALNLLFQGRYPEVPPLLDQADAASPPENLAFSARIEGHRGRLFHTLGSYTQAAMRFEQALAIPFDEPELRISLQSQLALSHLRQGKTSQAREETATAAEEARQIYSNNRIAAVPYINNLGAIAMALGELDIARSSFSEAMQMLETALGPEAPGLIGPLNNLGVAEQELGDYAAARIHLERAAALQAKHLPLTHLRVAETERNLARNSLLEGAPNAKDHIVKATRIGLDLLDRLVTAGSENERLNFLERFDLVSLPCATGDAELIANVLIATKARLLDTLLANQKLATRPNWQQVQAALSPDSALIDTCRFTTTTVPSESRYGALVILPSGPPKWIPLGTDESLKDWLAAFHARLRWRSAPPSGETTSPPALKTRAILRALEREFWTPLDLPPEIRHIAYSPDSRLYFLPLAALLNQENQPLSTRFRQITTVTSARDLLGEPATTQLSGSPWAVLNISNFPKSPLPEDGDPLRKLLAELEPMPGTHEESEKIRRIAPAGSIFLSDQQVRENSLRDLSASPAVLHLGCHAFFLEETNTQSGMPIDFDEHSELLFSGGLVLYHGAERKPASPRLADDDDLLFPAEIAKLPLRQTRLVTLSACDSGVGTPVSGEGLLGIRRAFSVAGAREVLVALWPVSDESTPDFMQRFYQLAMASDRPAQALWQAQGEFLGAARTEEDFELAVLRYGPFVLSQNSPLTEGAIISAAPLIAQKKSWWLALTAVPLLGFLLNQFFVRKKRG